LLTWTSARNPQTWSLSRHPSGTLPPGSCQPLRPLFPPNALMSHNRPHTPLVGLVPPPPPTPTPLTKRKGKKELGWLHPHHHLTLSGPPPQLTRTSRDTTCHLPLPHYVATLRYLPRNTPTSEKRRNSPKGSTPPVPPGPPVIWTPTGNPPPLWPPRPLPPMPKVPHPLLKERRVVRRKVLSWLPPLQLLQERFLRNLTLPSPKLFADSSPPEPPWNPTQKRSK